jgi:hypothetical protein
MPVELRLPWTQRREEWREIGVQINGAKLAEDALQDLEQLAAAQLAPSASRCEAFPNRVSQRLSRRRPRFGVARSSRRAAIEVR